MVVSGIHFRALDRVGDFGRQIFDLIYATLECPQTLEFFVLTRRHEISAHPPITGDGDRLALCLFFVPPEGFGEWLDLVASMLATNQPPTKNP